MVFLDSVMLIIFRWLLEYLFHTWREKDWNQSYQWKPSLERGQLFPAQPGTAGEMWALLSSVPHIRKQTAICLGHYFFLLNSKGWRWGCGGICYGRNIFAVPQFPTEIVTLLCKGNELSISQLMSQKTKSVSHLSIKNILVHT